MQFESLIEHYGGGYESGRLRQGAGLVERDRTQAIIRRRLAADSTVIYDIGGGPGAYAVWLLELGHTVHLVDPVPGHVDEAHSALSRTNSTTWSASVGDACALAFPESSADVVLLLGPLYHITDRSQRIAALREANRVLRPGGVVFAAAISRYASLIDGMTRNLLDDPAFHPIVDRDLEEGQHRNPTSHPHYFMTAYFHRPDELRAEMETGGFTVERICGVEGPTWMIPDIENRWRDETRRRRWLELLERVECESDILGMSAHLLAIGCK